jgi:hypothetical protein
MVIAVLGFSLSLWAQEPRFSGSREVVFSQNVLVGSQILPARTYKVTHEMERAEHIIIFTQNQTEFRVKCRLEPLTEKARITLYWYDDSVRGHPILQWIEFRGDVVRHVFRR